MTGGGSRTSGVYRGSDWGSHGLPYRQAVDRTWVKCQTTRQPRAWRVAEKPAFLFVLPLWQKSLFEIPNEGGKVHWIATRIRNLVNHTLVQLHPQVGNLQPRQRVLPLRLFLLFL